LIENSKIQSPLLQSTYMVTLGESYTIFVSGISKYFIYLVNSKILIFIHWLRIVSIYFFIPTPATLEV